MEILVVRHGQSVADIEDRHEGRADFMLTELGRRQAKCVSEWIRDYYKIDIIFLNKQEHLLKL